MVGDGNGGDDDGISGSLRHELGRVWSSLKASNTAERWIMAASLTWQSVSFNNLIV